MGLALASWSSDQPSELPCEFNKFRTLSTSFDSELAALFFELNGSPRPCFSPEVLEELRELQTLVRNYAEKVAPARPIRYLVGASGAPGGVNFGGDLEFFLRCLRRKDEYALSGYAKMAIDILYDNLLHLGSNITTVAVVRGPTLGAAFEAALSCDVIVADAEARIGFPEVLFNLFPGMGAYPLMARRIAPAIAERMIVSGKQHTGKQLFDLGLVDSVYSSDDPEHSVRRFIQQCEKTSTTRNGVLSLREIAFPISKDHLLQGVDVWVDAMGRVSSEQIERMESLLRLQKQRE